MPRYVVTNTFLALLLASGALAHQNLSHRHAAMTVRLQPDRSIALDLMLTLHVVGARASLLRANGDVDRNGRFSNAEARLLGLQLTKEALGGLEIRCRGAKLVPQNVQYKVSSRSAQKLTVAFLLAYQMDVSCLMNLNVASLAGQQRRGLEPLSVFMSAMPPLRFEKRRPLSFDLLPGKVRQVQITRDSE